jgi:hypothetical protein
MEHNSCKSLKAKGFPLSLLLILSILCPISARAHLEVQAASVFWFPRYYLDEQNAGLTGVGASGRAGWRFTHSGKLVPSVFLEASFLNSGRRSKNYTLYPGKLISENHGEYWVELAQLISSHRILSLCPGISVELKTGTVIPYAEFFAGVTSVKNDVDFYINKLQPDWSYEVVELDSPDPSTSTYALGLGVGSKILVWTHTTNKSVLGFDALMIDFKINYVWTGNAESFNPYSVEREADQYSYGSASIRMNQWQFRVGANLVL